MDGWKTTFLLGRPIFRGYVSFRDDSLIHPPFHWTLASRQQGESIRLWIHLMLKLKRWWWKSYMAVDDMAMAQNSGISIQGTTYIGHLFFYSKSQFRNFGTGSILVKENACWGVNHSWNISNIGVFNHQILFGDPVGTFESKWSSSPRGMRIREMWKTTTLILLFLLFSWYLQEVQLLSTSMSQLTSASMRPPEKEEACFSSTCMPKWCSNQQWSMEARLVWEEFGCTRISGTLSPQNRHCQAAMRLASNLYKLQVLSVLSQ